MVNVAVVFHSGYGHTERLAQWVAQGAEAELLAIDPDGGLGQAEWGVLDAAHAIVFGTPTYMGSPSWQFKRFADASSSRWYQRAWQDKVAGGFTISSHLSGDKSNTLSAVFTLAMQHGMVWVGQAQMAEDGLNRLGASTGLMAQVGSNQSAQEIPEKDLKTALLYGQRLADFTRRLHA